MDRFELGMGDRGLNKNRKVDAIGESGKTVHLCGDPFVMRPDELCAVGSEASSSDPHLLIALRADNVGLALLQWRTVNFQTENVYGHPRKIRPVSPASFWARAALRSRVMTRPRSAQTLT